MRGSLRLAAAAMLSMAGLAAAQEALVISEFMAANTSRTPLSAGELLDKDGESSDWIEIWNPSSVAVNLEGWFLTDNLNNLMKWEFPAAALAPGGFLVVFASGKNERDPAAEFHTSFALAAGGESLALVAPDGTVAHAYVDYPPQFADVSYGMNSADAGLATAEVLVAQGAEATALVPTDGSLGSDWTLAGFNDAHWLHGTTGVGFDYPGNVGLDVGAMRGVNPTVYVRIPFRVEDEASVNRLTLHMKYEDGFVAYLNGFEVVRSNAPSQASLSWNAAATENRLDSDAVVFEDFDISAHANRLVPGDNVLAIQGLNIDLISSDLLILPELIAVHVHEVDLSTVLEGYLVQPTPGAPNEGALAQIGPTIRDVTENPPPPDPDEDLVITARVVQTLAPVVGVMLTWQVDLDVLARMETHGTVPMVDDGTGGDATAGDGVYTAIIPASAYEEGSLIRWRIDAVDSQGRTSRDPLFLRPDDSPEYYGTVAQDPTLSTSLPVLYWFSEQPARTRTRSGGRASVFFDGEFYDNVFVRERGAYTTNGSQKFVFNRGHKFRFSPEHPRVHEFNLNSNGSDSSYLRQPLAFETMRKAGSPASLSFLMLSVCNGNVDRVGIFIEQVDEEFLERNNLDPAGALYKFVQRSSSAPVFNDISSGIEKKSRENEGREDVAAIVAGLNASSEQRRRAFVFDRFNLPQMMCYLAARCLLQDTDDIRKNFYFYCDSDGSGEWSIFPWDKDWTFGVVGDGGVYTTHPFLGADSHPKAGGSQWSVYLSVMYHLPETQEMFLRRLRTVMDEQLQPPGTPADRLVFENRINEMVNQARGYLAGSASSLRNYFPPRRMQLYVDHSIHNTTNPPAGGVAGIPDPQPEDVSILFGDYDCNPVSGNQDEEYIELVNPNAYAVDISGWKLTGGIEHEFAPGTVIISGGSLYVSPDVRAFRQRETYPTGGQGLFVQGNYRGHLSSRGETIDLQDRSERLVATLMYPGVD
ncbi:MAG: lamin tail domain-containing protein [Sedimentisphaerales bacterium]|nr:lamin tail domain-containing protein [Sedimentisphaerales bacterium]HNY78378.1 lamin tail domain-containing protein [Sedimentisphaerales bacterium]HOC63534.1 lamin tail domain-containing protein [Sedimentisphaerales bacterium]HOH62845.1 lamin tail domain-containing protein [Sedimentisphaerales bacterium]HPY49578.1 lamin tail domain-containing protein [Sedimentisphaerales bacterium]